MTIVLFRFNIFLIVSLRNETKRREEFRFFFLSFENKDFSLSLYSILQLLLDLFLKIIASDYWKIQANQTNRQKEQEQNQ